MLKNLQTIEEIEEYFRQSYEQSFGKIHRAQIYGLAFDMQEQRSKEESYAQQIESKYRKILKTTIISNDLAIVEAESKMNSRNEVYYYPVVNGKSNSESAKTFDEALVMALTSKYTNSTSFTPAIYNMLRMDLKNK